MEPQKKDPSFGKSNAQNHANGKLTETSRTREPFRLFASDNDGKQPNASGGSFIPLNETNAGNELPPFTPNDEYWQWLIRHQGIPHAVKDFGAPVPKALTDEENQQFFMLRRQAARIRERITVLRAKFKLLCEHQDQFNRFQG